jgi:hypothetical protein
MQENDVRITVQHSTDADETVIMWDSMHIGHQVLVRSGVLRDLLDLPPGTIPLPITRTRFSKWLNHTPSEHATAETLVDVMEVRFRLPSLPR